MNNPFFDAAHCFERLHDSNSLIVNGMRDRTDATCSSIVPFAIFHPVWKKAGITTAVRVDDVMELGSFKSVS